MTSNDFCNYTVGLFFLSVAVCLCLGAAVVIDRLENKSITVIAKTTDRLID